MKKLILTNQVCPETLHPCSPKFGKLIYNAFDLLGLSWKGTFFHSCVNEQELVRKTSLYTQENYSNLLCAVNGCDLILSFSDLVAKFQTNQNILVLPSYEDIRKKKFEPLLSKPYLYTGMTEKQILSDTKRKRGGYKHRLYKFLEEHKKAGNLT